MDNSALSKEQLLHEVALLQDQISELKALQEKYVLADKELRRAKEYAEFLFKSTPSAIFTTDINRIITSWNNKAEEITGYSAQEIIGKQCTFFAESPCKGKCNIFSGQIEKPFFRRECTIRRKDGRIIIVSMNGDLLKDENGNIIGGIESVEDITGRKRKEEDFQQSYQNLEIQVRERTSELSNINEALLVEIMQRKKVQKNFEDANEKLTRLLNETIKALASAVEKRDPYTAGHQQRVAMLAAAIGQEMELPEEQLTGVKTAAIIHDIGKICTPAEILSKPSKLTVYEFNLITIHPEVGYEILKGIEFPWPVSEIVLQHHERFDGSGYPRGLTGENILPEAHILIVSDVVEAMASHRPYRPALGIDKALEEIVKKKGKLYASNVVDACINVFTKRGFSLEESK